MDEDSLASPRLVGAVAAGVGAAAGGALGGAIGYYALVEPVEHVIGGPLFLFAILLLAFGLISPLTWFVFLRDQFESPTLRWAAAITGNVLVVTLAILLAYFGVFRAIGVTEPREAIMFFDALGGATFVGLGFGRLASRWTADRQREGAAEESWDDAGTGRWGDG